MKHFFLLLFIVCLTGCFHQNFGSYEHYLQSRHIPPVSVSEFPHCQGYGCPQITRVSLNDQSWSEFKYIFTPPSRSAEQERTRIKQAISLFERKVGPLTHTDVDVGDTFKKTGKGQLDCVDESTNTTIYMALLEQKGWILLHDIEPPQVRTPFTTGAWPHQTASIQDKKTGARFAVDSWFDDNGLPPYIVPLDDWIMGWKPADWDQR